MDLLRDYLRHRLKPAESGHTGVQAEEIEGRASAMIEDAAGLGTTHRKEATAPIRQINPHSSNPAV